ncbi:MAG: MFS transporter [Chloroflexota bacterium]
MIAQLRSLYYGWWIIITLAITETISWGIVYYAYSVIITTLEAEFGWTRAEVTGAFSLALLISGGMAVPVGFWLDRYSSRWLMTAGSIVATLLMFVLAQVQTLTQLYLVWIGLGITAATILYEPAFVVAAKWFNKKRGTALVIITIAAGFASTIFLPLTAWLLGLYGWRQAMVYLAILLGVTTIPLHALVLRRSPADMGLAMDGGTLTASTEQRNTTSTQQTADKQTAANQTAANQTADNQTAVNQTSKTDMTLREVLRLPRFWWLAISLSLGGMAAIGIRVHFIPLLEDRGFAPEYAAWIAGIIGAMQVLGRVIYAPSGSSFSPTRMVTIIFSLQAVSLALLLFTSSSSPTEASLTIISVWSFVILFGAVYGISTLLRPQIIADQFGSTYFGRISSIQHVIYTVATTSAPYGMALIYTLFGNSYQPVLVVLILISLLAAAAVFPIKKK